MYYHLIGALFIILGCGSLGVSIAAAHRTKERYLQQLLWILQFMESELKFHLTALPELCHQAGCEVSGLLRNIFWDLAKELDWQCAPDVKTCMNITLKRSPDIPVCVRKILIQLGNSLGRYDLPGQLIGIQTVNKLCYEELKKLGKDRDSRLRSYQTLSLCAGAAVVILLV